MPEKPNTQPESGDGIIIDAPNQVPAQVELDLMKKHDIGITAKEPGVYEIAYKGSVIGTIEAGALMSSEQVLHSFQEKYGGTPKEFAQFQSSVGLMKRLGASVEGTDQRNVVIKAGAKGRLFYSEDNGDNYIQVEPPEGLEMTNVVELSPTPYSPMEGMDGTLFSFKDAEGTKALILITEN